MTTLVNLLAKLPLRWLHALGSLLGWLAYALSPSYRAQLRANADLAGLDAAQRRAAVAAAGQLVMELPHLWLRPQGQSLGDAVRWEGAEVVDRALAQGRGLVLLTPHLGGFEAVAQAYAERWGGAAPLTAMYRPAKQAWLRQMEETARNRPGLLTAPATLSGVRQMIRALRRGETVGLLPDQVPPQGMGVWAPFFGRPAYTMTLATRLVQQTGAAWLLMEAQRLPHGEGYVARVSVPREALPLAVTDGADLAVACATRVNEEMESLIRRNPTQYLWGYKRYKQPRAGLDAA